HASVQTGGTHGVTVRPRPRTDSSRSGGSQHVGPASRTRRERSPGRHVSGHGASHAVGQAGTVVPSSRATGWAAGWSATVAGWTETSRGVISAGGPARATDANNTDPTVASRVMAGTSVSGRREARDRPD